MQQGLYVSVTAHVKVDGYVVMKIQPKVTLSTSIGTKVRQYQTDTRVRAGQTLVLAGWSTADEVLLVTVKILPKRED